MERGVTVRYKSVSKPSVLNHNIAHTELTQSSHIPLTTGNIFLLPSQVRREESSDDTGGGVHINGQDVVGGLAGLAGLHDVDVDGLHLS